jgi:Transposase DDE domain
LFDARSINRLAQASGLIKRKRKLSGVDLVTAMLGTVVNQMPSYNALSYYLFSQSNKDVSRQRLHKIISSDNFVVFFKRVIHNLLEDRILLSGNQHRKKFKRILIQDSTILKLPKRLFQLYSGASNASVTVANCRIQVCIDLMTNFIESFGADSYSVNDTKARDYIDPKKGDLVLRDRGYYVIDQVLKFAQQGVHFIIRHKSSNQYYDEDGNQIDLIKELSRKNKTTLKVKLTKDKGPSLTLFAQRLDTKTVAKRLRTAKLNSKGRNPSKRTIEQLQWAIFITDLDENEYTLESIWKLYSLRWRIEILFKTLKTHLHLDTLQNVSSNQLQIIILARFALISLITTNIYNPLQSMLIKTKSNKIISLMKLAGNLLINIDHLAKAILYFKPKRKTNRKKSIKNLIQKLIKSSAYDKRERLNFENQMKIALLS